MGKQKIFFTLIVLFFGVGGIILYQSLRAENAKGPVAQEKCNQSATTQDCKPISLATSTWQVFENTKYSYAISYPPGGSINSRDDYVDDISKAEAVYFSIPGRFTLGGVDATLYPNYPLSDAPSKDLDLKSYAESLRMLQVNYPNPNYKDQEIGEIKETTIDGRKSYQFTLDQGFTTQKKSGLGYSIPPNQTYLYTVTENSRRQKIILYHLLDNTIAERMFQTFEFR